MNAKVLAKEDWSGYFSQINKKVEGKRVRIEVLGALLGDQVLVKSVSLLGVTYEAKEERIELMLKGITHVIDKPRKVSVQEDDGVVRAIEVVDGDERHQLLTFN